MHAERPIQILELFGGIGAPRAAMRNIGVPVKAIDYVEIDAKAVRSYNAMFKKDLAYKTQNVIGWNLRPDILIHGSPCQDFSIAGHQGKATAEGGRINRGRGADEGSGTRSSLMWETLNIIRNMGVWKPRVVIWENVKNVLSRHMRPNFEKYLHEMQEMGYTSVYKVISALDYGLPQARERVFTVSVLGGQPFDFERMQKRPTQPLESYLESGIDFTPYKVTQQSILSVIGHKGIRRAAVIKDRANTITCRQDRSPAQVIEMEPGQYRYLTERECWRLMGFSDADYLAAKEEHGKQPHKMQRDLYKQAGNSMPIPVLEEIFSVILATLRGAEK